MPTPLSDGKFRRRLFLMRHADVTYFDENRKPVPPNEVPLNAEGTQQAQAAARMLQGIKVDCVITSDLPRTRQTAEIVLSQMTQPPEIETNPTLREIQPGHIASMSPDAVKTAFLEAFGSQIQRDSHFLGGETFGEFEDRVRPAYQALVADTSWSTALIVAHGGVNRVLLLEAMGMSLAGVGALEQDPACINILDISDDGQAMARLINHTPYNPTKDGMMLTTMERLLHQFMG